MAPPADASTTITLRIKVPPGHIEDAADEFTLGADVPVSASMGEIRERIQRAVPSNPAPERQRILYAGRALVDNEQTLGDALNIRRDPTQTDYVVHLLIKGDGTAATAGAHARSQSAAASGTALAGLPRANGNGNTPQPAHGQQLPPQDSPNIAQFLQQQQARLVAQQHQFMHEAHHNRFVAGQGPGPQVQGPQGQGGLPAALFPMMPPAQQLGHHGLGPQLVVQPFMPQAQAPQPGSQVAHPDGTAERPRQADPQQRSASQPPPRPHGQNVIVEGRGPNGERFHFQRHMQLGPQPMPMLPALGLPQLQPFVLPQPAPPNAVRSAVEQARDNLAEMRRLLDELRELDGSNDEQRSRIERLQQRAQQVYDFVDPFGLGGSAAPAATDLNNMRAPGTAHGMSVPRASSQPPSVPGNTYDLPSTVQPTTSSRTIADVTCYLLSSSTGPRAILYSPQHGTYTGGMSPVEPHPTRTTQPAATNANEQPLANQAQAVAVQPVVAQAAAVQQENPGALGPLINHMWLLIRVLIFVYFIIGANLGWRRPLAMLAIALGFWLLRQGPLGEGGVLRRWWNGIVNQAQRPVPAQGNGQQQGQVQAGNVRPGQMPTPAQVAQRLLDEDRQQRNHRLSWLREQLRPAERALALLVASLWPGVGEAYVRAVEAEERRRNEEEVAARRREEEERQQREEEEKKNAEEAATSTETKDSSQVAAVEAGSSTAATTAVDGNGKTDA